MRRIYSVIVGVLDYILRVIPELLFIILFRSLLLIIVVVKRVFFFPRDFLSFLSTLNSVIGHSIILWFRNYSAIWPVRGRLFFFKVSVILAAPFFVLSRFFRVLCFTLKVFLAPWIFFKLSAFALLIAPLLYSVSLVQLCFLYLRFLTASVSIFFIRAGQRVISAYLTILGLWDSFKRIRPYLKPARKGTFKFLFGAAVSDFKRHQFGGGLALDKIENFRHSSKVFDLNPYFLVGVQDGAYYYPYRPHMAPLESINNGCGVSAETPARAARMHDVGRWLRVLSPIVQSNLLARRYGVRLLPGFDAASVQIHLSEYMRSSFMLERDFRRKLFIDALANAPFFRFSFRNIGMIPTVPIFPSSEWFDSQYSALLRDSTFSYNLFDVASNQFFKKPEGSMDFGFEDLDYAGDLLYGEVGSVDSEILPKPLAGSDNLFFVDDLERWASGLLYSGPDRFWFKRILRRQRVRKLEPYGGLLVIFVHWIDAIVYFFVRFFRRPIVSLFWSVTIYLQLRYIRIKLFFTDPYYSDLKRADLRYVISAIYGEVLRIIFLMPLYPYRVYYRLRALWYSIKRGLRKLYWILFAPIDFTFFFFRCILNGSLPDLVHTEFEQSVDIIRVWFKNRVFEFWRSIT